MWVRPVRCLPSSPPQLPPYPQPVNPPRRNKARPPQRPQDLKAGPQTGPQDHNIGPQDHKIGPQEHNSTMPKVFLAKYNKEVARRDSKMKEEEEDCNTRLDDTGRIETMLDVFAHCSVDIGYW